jgi:hypothetical protein
MSQLWLTNKTKQWSHKPKCQIDRNSLASLGIGRQGAAPNRLHPHHGECSPSQRNECGSAERIDGQSSFRIPVSFFFVLTLVVLFLVVVFFVIIRHFMKQGASHRDINRNCTHSPHAQWYAHSREGIRASQETRLRATQAFKSAKGHGTSSESQRQSCRMSFIATRSDRVPVLYRKSRMVVFRKRVDRSVSRTAFYRTAQESVKNWNLILFSCASEVPIDHFRWLESAPNAAMRADPIHELLARTSLPERQQVKLCGTHRN